MEKRIGINAKLLILSDLFYSLTSIFVNTFLVAYFLTITNESILKISIYYIIVYSLLAIGNLLMSMVIKKYPSKRKILMCSGIIARATFILLIGILQEKIASQFVLIAIFYSVGESLYWCAHELIYIDVTNNDNRKNYISTNRILSKFVKIVSPIILGTSIELYSFTKIAIYVFILTLIQVTITLFIKTDITSYNKNKYKFKEFLNYIKQNKVEKIKKYRLSAMAYGIVESSISTLITIITVMTFKTSFSLGVLTTIFNVFSMLSLMLYNKFYNKKNAKLILILCSIIAVSGVLGLLININKISLVIYNFCYIVTFCIFNALYNTKKGNLIKECNIEKYREEFIGYTSIALGFGRITGYILMLLVSFTSNLIYFKVLLAIVTSFVPIYSLIMIKLENIEA